jgi:Rab-3A-interacting protein
MMMMMMEQLPLVGGAGDPMIDHRSDVSDANSVDSAFSLDNGVVTPGEHHLSSSTLLDELHRVKKDLKHKEIEVQRAHEIRENADKEIEDLTASLFESAHSMVEQAKYAQANAEQKLKVANQTIEALVLENSQLKKTVGELKEIMNSCRSSILSNRSLSITPLSSSPTSSTSILNSTEQQQQISNLPSQSSIRQLVREKFHQHKRSSSDLPYSLSSIEISNYNNDNLVDNVLFREFARWEERPSIGQDSSAFMHRIYNEDIRPCLTFPNAELSTRIIAAIERNDVIMEGFHARIPDENMKICSLTGDLCQCDYRIRICENGEWYPLSHLSRNRIASVCDFFTYIRHVQSGLVKSDTRSRYNKIIELRKQMAFARFGL